MKIRSYLLYGYFLPIFTSALVSIIPWLLDLLRVHLVSYEDISRFFVNRLDIIIAYTAILSAITFSWQTKIIHEDNPDVLKVLERNNIRKVFINASVFQAILILIVALFLCIISANSSSSIFGFIELLGFSLITFESFGLISNGQEYARIREKIVMKVHEANYKNSSSPK